MTADSSVLRDQIRATIKATGLKQIWIAQQLGISEKHLSQMLTGRVTLTLDWAQRIAGVCGYKVTVTVEPVAAGVRERRRRTAGTTS
ncbi:helix-turn-helix domain-containing protein [Streptomyces europaeiscabiei]|uniref:helix-turn-helix domain-containing protein n=1 Tax=Streptomyces europaeiscabiei TaxID=146819 RepID=UPI0029A01556|nr:helix-turn-helix transcriptional regulator [Streptomyces europaeiscabiei]MDX3587333.1 helix-turn-helix transcriptional regulator [Streptomyces europaeiscabiei]